MNHPYQPDPLEADLDQAERAAWQRGDYPTAALLRALLDSPKGGEDCEDLQFKLDSVRDRITNANWRTGTKAELRELIEAVLAELA